MVESHEGYVRGLARALLHDEHRVDDVVQQAWLRAMQSPPRETGTGSVRSWLRTVVRNLVRSDQQAESARLRREKVAVEGSRATAHVPSVAEIQERESVRRQMIQELLALPPKYRDVLVLRYLEGMTPKAISQRLSLPGATVRSLNARGLDLLRQRLDTAHGDRQRWCLALIPLAAPAAVSGTAATGLVATFVAWILIMKQHALVTLGIAGLILALMTAHFFDNSWPFAVEQPDATSMARNSAGARPGRTKELKASERQRLEPVAEADQPGAEGLGALRGHLLHADGRPAAGVSYWMAWGSKPPPRSGVTGQPMHEAPDSAGITDTEGMWHLPSPETADRGLLWCLPAENVRIAFEVDVQTPPKALRLPALVPISARVQGLGDDDHWRLLAMPAYPDRRGRTAGNRSAVPVAHDMNLGHALIQLTTGGKEQPVCYVLIYHDLNYLNKAEVTLMTIAGACYQVHLEGEGFRMAGNAIQLIRAPADLQASVGSPTPLVKVQVYEADDRTLTGLDGTTYVRIRKNMVNFYPLRDGQGSIGSFTLKWDQEYEFFVQMVDGELFQAKFVIPGAGASTGYRPLLQFRRGDGRPAQRIAAGPERRFRKGDRLEFTHTDGRLFGTTIGDESFLDGPVHACHLADGGATVVVQDERPWQRVWIIQQDGSVATVERVGGMSELTCRWLPTRELPETNLRDLAHQHGFTGETRFKYEIRIPLGNGRRWRFVDRFPPGTSWTVTLEPQDDRWPTWRKRVPVGWAHRVQLWESPRQKTVRLDR